MLGYDYNLVAIYRSLQDKIFEIMAVVLEGRDDEFTDL